MTAQYCDCVAGSCEGRRADQCANLNAPRIKELEQQVLSYDEQRIRYGKLLLEMEGKVLVDYDRARQIATCLRSGNVSAGILHVKYLDGLIAAAQQEQQEGET